MSTSTLTPPAPTRREPRPETRVKTGALWQTALLWLFLVGPLVALATGVALAAAVGLGPSWLDLGLAVIFYAVSGHVAGNRPFRSRDRSTNCWPLAVLSMGESWHNLHHADPTCARHGVDPRQVDSSAVVIRVFERLDRVRLPRP